jgi:hypothetical protein
MNISNFSLGIGMPLSFHMIPSAFFDSFISMEKPPFLYFRSSAGPVDDMRNNIVGEALKAKCTHLIMLDTDQCYHPKTITRLLSHRLPVVGALVYRRYPPFDPLMMKGDISKYQPIKEWEPNSLVEVDATGTGCLLFDMEVFRKMPAPWFRFRRDPKTWNAVGEDIGFCSELRGAGYKIFVDTSVTAGHLSQIQVTEPWWRLYEKLSEKEAEANALTIEHGILGAVKQPQ